jgi:hypothetical protein
MRSAQTIQYVVESEGGTWLVRRDGRHYGPYADRGAAIRQAIDAARTSGRNDWRAEVLSRLEDGTLRVEWTYGIDDYPPAGLI